MESLSLWRHVVKWNRGTNSPGGYIDEVLQYSVNVSEVMVCTHPKQGGCAAVLTGPLGRNPLLAGDARPLARGLHSATLT